MADRAQLLTDLFERQRSRTPEAIALVVGETSLTYRELGERADSVAAELAARKVGPDVIVGLSPPRGIEPVVASLAVLKTGGAYLPLDPSYPAARLRHMLTDSAARVLVTD